MIKSFKTRQKARRYALQALYSWFVSGNAVGDVEKFYLEARNPKKFDLEYFRSLLYNISANALEIDELMQPHLSRPVAEIDPIELTILRIATYELKEKIDVPYKVIINEALELAKTFGATDGHKFVNGVLDKLARNLRAEEHSC